MANALQQSMVVFLATLKWATSITRSRLIVTVHGIRTFGHWQERLEQQVESIVDVDEEVRFINYKYGYFSVLAFLIPVFRWLIVRRFRTELVALCGQRPWDRIDLVGHSFGTHVIAWAVAGLPKETPLQFHTIILSGSVLRSGFPWSDLLGKRVKRVVNDCGTRDKVLLLSQFFVLFTGMAGRTGFGGATSNSFRNRYFPFGHSGYFLTENGTVRDDFMEAYWLPLLRDDKRISEYDCRTPSAWEGFVTVLSNNAEPIKILVYVTPFALLAWFVYGLYAEATEQRLRAERAFDRASRSSTELVGELAQQFQSQQGIPDKLITGILRKAEGLVESLSGDGRENQQIQRALGVALAELSSRYLAQDDLDRSLEAASRALKIFGQLYELASDDYGRGADLVAAKDRMGDVLYRKGEFARALEIFDAELSLASELLRQRPRDPKAAELVATALEKKALVVVKANPQNALTLHQRSIEIRASLLLDNPRSVTIQNAIATSHLNIADILLARGGDAEALDQYRQSLDISRSILLREPSNTDYMRGAAVAEQRVGDYYKSKKDWGRALSHYQRDLEIMLDLIKSDETNFGWRRDALTSYFRTGDALLSMVRTPDALANFERALNLAKSFARAEPDWRAISALYQRICRSFAVMTRFNEARARAEEGVAFFDRVVETHSAERPRLGRMLNNAAWYAILAQSYDVALNMSERAIVIDQASIEFRINKLHALVLSAPPAVAKQHYEELKLSFSSPKVDDLIKADVEGLRALGFDANAIGRILAILE